MCGPSIRGALGEGEHACAVGSYRSGTIHADRVINRTTGAVITASPATSTPVRIGLVVTAIAAVVFVIFMISIFTSHP
jgi:secreted trypsin-like serine protease